MPRLSSTIEARGTDTMTAICEIKWLNERTGQFTPDTNPAIGRARTIARVDNTTARPFKYEASQWFNICACHAERLTDKGMHIWEFERFACE
jgi:hypothetical protein